MLSLLFIVFAALAVIFGVIFQKSDNENGLSLAVSVFSGIVAIIVLCVLIFSFPSITKDRVYDEQIQLYEEANRTIEEKVEKAVYNYMQYEKETFEKIKFEGDAMTMISLFPELKSDALVAQMIEEYSDNIKAITKLKADKASLSTDRWLIYFGH